jgi:hypothetical protein
VNEWSGMTRSEERREKSSATREERVLREREEQG